MIYGYCRISTKAQRIERQERNILKDYPTAVILKEAYTGTKIEGRKEWHKIYTKAKAGDTIVFDSVSRMSRSAEDGVKLYFELFEKGIELIFLNEPYINTETYKAAMQQSISATGNDIADIYIEATNKVIKLLAEKQIIKAFEQAQKEVDDLRTRTKGGIETARLNGKQIGAVKGAKLTTKKSIAAKDIIKKHSKDFNGTLEDGEVIKLAGISRNSFYKYKKEIREEMAAI